ncbi:MAG: hypothetical protein ABEK16_05585 [Candidatus Nanohalobium sp.]
MRIRPQPQLEKGFNRVEKPGRIPVFQSILASQLDGRNASAVWIDTGNEASTYALNSFSPELMEKVKIGRAFTPFQHHSLVHQVEEFIEEDTEVLILPNIAMMYADGQLREWEARELFKETWNHLKDVQEEEELKVVFSARNFSDIIGPDVETEIEVEETGQGLRYSGKSEQMAYDNPGDK